jgi:hypothetical protein
MLRLCKRLRPGTQFAAETTAVDFKGCPKKEASSSLMLSSDDENPCMTYFQDYEQLLITLRTKDPAISYRALRVKFVQLLGKPLLFISEANIRNICVSYGITRKVLGFQNYHQDLDQKILFLRSIQHISAENVVSIDGLVQSNKDYHATKGYAPKGRRAIQLQICIRSKTFAVMVACTVDGIIAYQIYEGNVGQDHVAFFINNVLKPKLSATHYAILDNAKNQNNQLIRDLLEVDFHGRYCFLPAYTPQYAPVENLIGNVKGRIRSRETDASLSEHDLIVEALEYYSTHGQGGPSARNMFNIYEHNNTVFLESLRPADGIDARPADDIDARPADDVDAISTRS